MTSRDSPRSGGDDRLHYRSKRDRPRVSVGLAVFDGERFVRDALNALLSQTFTDFELIISDNASTDATADICQYYARRDTHIRYFRQPYNIGALANFHFVLNQACGEYFVWVAHDDLWEPDFIASLVDALDRDRGAVLAFCRYDNIDSEGRVIKLGRRDWARIFRRGKFMQLAYMVVLSEDESQKANHIYGLMRRSALDKAFAAVADVDAYSGNDVCTLLELLDQGEFRIVDKVLFHYRTRSDPPGRRGRSVPAQHRGLARYVWQRTAGAVPDHRGNLISFLRADAQYFGAIRRIVRRHGSLRAVQRFVLEALITFRQISRPLRMVWVAARRELF